VADLSSTGGNLDKRIAVVEDDIDDLRGQISDLGGADAGASGGVTTDGNGDSGDTGGTPP
jgi:hypothetical protein